MSLLQGIEAFIYNKAMKIASVYPIVLTRQSNKEPLTYFVNDSIEPHALVKITVRKKQVTGIVDTLETVGAQKMKVRTSRYALKKINAVLSPAPPFHPLLLPIAKQLGDYYFEPPGSILKLFVPTAVLSDPARYLRSSAPPDPFQDRQSEIVVGTFEERVAHYNNIIRGAFAKGKSVALFVPTTRMADYTYRALSDLPKKIFIIHGNLSKKLMQEQSTGIYRASPPVLVIGTPLMLGCLSGAEHIIIIEDADSLHYIRHEHPRIHMTKAIKIFADEIQAKCINGKSMLSLHDLKNGVKPNYLSVYTHIKNLHVLIDMTPENPRVLSKKVIARLGDDARRAILFVNRRGFYSFVLCLDCGNTVLCPQCSSPLTMHDGASHTYQCHHCQKEYPSDTVCNTCHGWNLKGYGTGTQRVFDEIRTYLPQRPCWIFDDDHIKSRQHRDSVVKSFLASPDGILIGTEMILEEPSVVADWAVVVNSDNMLSIPDYQIHERMLALMVKLDEKTRDRSLWIQTRFIRHPFFSHIARNDIKSFLEQELRERKKEHFPPFSTFLLLTLSHKDKKELNRRVEETLTYFEPRAKEFFSYPAFIQKIRGLWEHHLLLSIDKTQWQRNEKELRAKLATFIYGWDIVVDPQSIL